MAQIDYVAGARKKSFVFVDGNGVELTDAQARTISELYIQEWSDPMPEGLTQGQQVDWIMEQFLKRLMADAYGVIRKQRRKNKMSQRETEDRQEEALLGL